MDMAALALTLDELEGGAPMLCVCDGSVAFVVPVVAASCGARPVCVQWRPSVAFALCPRLRGRGEMEDDDMALAHGLALDELEEARSRSAHATDGLALHRCPRRHRGRKLDGAV